MSNEPEYFDVTIYNTDGTSEQHDHVSAEEEHELMEQAFTNPAVSNTKSVTSTSH